ncbi:amidase [Amycolatopsis tolypomycina]|uniref:Amidase n=1 Tax=Amycolatopsis tolypomycina TaxID=208445 RepID=A0A1H4TKC2_9PSEU|nr:amidase [Amycolatopsis tolypomycina]SEC56708.1 amidase [Amycolatopsis tolypomycina]
MDPFGSATDLAAAVRRRELSPVEIADAYLARIDRYDPGINAFVWRNDEDVRAAAKAAEQAVTDGGPLGPFHGVPIPIKELTQVDGQPATYGSLGVSDAPRSGNEPVVTRLLDAGFLLMGRTNSPEMGLLTTTENERFGATRNPWQPAYSPGGSSGGAAAAVAAGLAPVAHASDGGGSIRVPSSCCGLVGLKPSRGRIPQPVAAWEHATVEGAITRYVRDAAALLDVMSVPDRLAWYQAPAPRRPFLDEVGAEAGRLRIGLLTASPTGMPVDPECAEAAEKAARLLESLGHDVYPVEPEFLSEEAWTAYAQTVLDASVAAMPYDEPALVGSQLRYRMDRAKSRDSGTYVRASLLLQEETRGVVAQWGRDFDVLLTPTIACRPPFVGSVLQEAVDNPGGLRLTEMQMISFTSFCNVTGLPAISLPVHTSSDGLPVGAQLVAGPWEEAVLIRLASALEPLVGWTRRHAVLE